MTDGIFNLAARHQRWVAARREAVAQNLANSDRPDFKARTAPSFAAFLNDASSENAMQGNVQADAVPTTSDTGTEDAGMTPQLSGNTVDVEREMLKAGDVSRDHALSVAVTRSFQRMFLMTTKG